MAGSNRSNYRHPKQQGEKLSAKKENEYIGLRSAGGATIPPLGGWPAEPEPEPACVRSAGGVPIKPFSGGAEQAQEMQAPQDPVRTPQKKGLIARIIDKLLGRN